MMKRWNNHGPEQYSITPIFHHSISLAELAQEPQIILKKEPDIVDAVFQHGNALHSHAEGEAGNLFRVITDEAKNRGINQAGTEYFQPAGAFANAAGLPRRAGATTAANQTLDVDLSARFSERKETR